MEVQELKAKYKVGLTVTMILCLLVGGFSVDRFYQDKINKLEKDLERGEVYKFVPIPLDQVDFSLIDHLEGIPTIHDEQSYWDRDYLIKVFRSGKRYYIKIYTEWEGKPE